MCARILYRLFTKIKLIQGTNEFVPVSLVPELNAWLSFSQGE